MKKIKSIITGILSGAVFFMAMQAGVAQEATKASDDKVEVKASPEAMALAGTVAKLNTGIPSKHAEIRMADYWVYNSSTTGFADTAKYIKVTLASPGSQNCPSGNSFPCVYKEASGALSTKEGLHTELQSLGSDSNIRSASIRQKGS